MEEDYELKMLVRKVDRSDLHANSKTFGSTISRRFYGSASQSGKGVPGQHEEDRSH